jgi:3-phenylpropionate/trans-cinnamate dioxygenase ferredoxin subunit
MDMSDSRRLAAAALAEGESVALEVCGQSVLVCRSSGQLYAVSNRCTHAGSRLEGGKVREGIITCPLHGARFHLSTGECAIQRLNYEPLKTFPVREVGGHLEIDVPEST